MTTAAEQSLAEVRALSAGHTLNRRLVTVPYHEGKIVVPRAPHAVEFRGPKLGFVRSKFETAVRQSTGLGCEKILTWAKRTGGVFTSKDVSDRFGVGTSTACSFLKVLHESGKLNRQGTGGRNNPFTYSVAED